jgi:trk system potassium uptake protein
MNQRILANLGFLLQTAGLLTLLPIGVGFYFNETQELIPLFITCVMFLCGGFMLNALCERKDLNIKSSSALLILAFIILPLIGSIPYIYLDPFNSQTVPERFTNSYFESVSGFTTTGFSFIAETAIIPKCLLVFRSLTELMGGVGIVFLILAFFQSKRGMPKLSGTLGIDNLNGNLKRMFASVLAIYSVIIITFIAIFYLIGYTDLISTGTFIIDTITGGFQPTGEQYTQYLFIIPKILLIVLMFFGSVNFAFNYYLITGKIKKLFTLEISLFIAIIVAASIALVFIAKIDWLDSLFHVVSMASTTGQFYLNIPELDNYAISILIILTVIGGCTFSMAGGIKVANLLTFGETVGYKIKMIFTKPSKRKKQAIGSSEELFAIASILLFIAVLLCFTLLFSTIGLSFRDSLFEVASALSTNGVSMGATSVAMPLAYKWIMIFAMTIGRVEIITILLILVPMARKKLKIKRAKSRV